MPDDYGIDLAITDDGDLSVGPNGGLVLVDELANVHQALRMRMLTVPGELPMHPDYGSRLKERLVGAKADEPFAASIATQELRRIVETDRRFIGASDLKIITDPAQPGIQGVAVKLQLAGGQELSVENLASPQADEIDFSAAPTLATFGDDESIETFDDAGLAVVDDLPELEAFIGEGTATANDTDPPEDAA